MITINYETPEGKSDIKEFKKGKCAANYVEKIVSKEVVNNITQGKCTGVICGEGTLECDVPFNSFMKMPVSEVDEPDRNYRKTKGRKKR